MRKVVLLALVSLLLSTAVVVGFVRPVAAHPAEIIVPDDYPKIQWAIGNATDGDTIFVRAETYYEHVVVYKPLTLIGEDRSTTIIDGNETGMVVRSNAPNVEIRGFTVQNGGGNHPYGGIQIGSYVNNTIRDCITRNNGLGIYLYNSNDSVIVGNKIMDSSWAGICVRDSNNNDIHANIIVDNSWGVWITSLSSTYNKLYHNNFINNIYHVQGSGSNTKWDNGAEGNYWDDYTGEDLDGDGIGDTPYLGVDTCPLMEPWSLFRTFNVTWNEETYNVTTFCNSTVASFKSNQSLAQISFNVTGPPDTIGFCNVTIPKTLLVGAFTVFIDDNSTKFTPVDNATHTSLYFNYNHTSTRHIIIQGTIQRIPVADADGPYEGYEGSPITFDASNSTPNGGEIVLYEWDWDNDGTYDESTTSVLINHTWPDDHTGTVRLRVTDDGGLNDTDTASVTVYNVAPTVNAGLDETADEGSPVTFSGSFTDPGTADTHTIFWDFGDGSNTTGTLTPTHAYGDNGVYTVTLNVTDDDGESEVDTLTVTVYNVAPTVEAGFDRAVHPGQTVYFDGSFTDPGWLDTHTIFWDFGDASNASGTLTPTHNYTDVGVYTVTLNVTDDDGGVGIDTLNVTVSIEPVHDVRIFSVTPNVTKVVQGSAVNITVVAPNEGTDTESFNVTAYANTTEIETQKVTNLASGNQTTLTFIWYTTGVSLGNYTIKAVASTVENETDTADNTYIDGTVKVMKHPVADANGPYSGYEGSPITFNASGSSDMDGTIVLYEWDWDNDGTYDENATSPFINHTWTDNFSGKVGLRVTDDDGLTDTANASVTVQNVAPTVEAGPDQTVNEGDTVSFSGNFTDPGANDIHTFFWDFGDGSNASDTLTPTHVYGDNGVYTVTLNVTDDDDGVGTDTLTVTVNNVAPIVYAGPDQTVNEGDLVSFNASFTDPGWLDTHTIFWDFGDSSNASGTRTPTHVYTEADVYTVTLKVTDDDDEFGTDALSVTVLPVVFPVAVDGWEFNVVIDSNSTVSDFDFRKGEMEISFSVTGPDGTVGFCNVTIPTDLMKGEPSWLIRIDDIYEPEIINISDNGTHTFLYFTYTHTTHNIKIRGTWVIPEFPTLIPLLLILAILAVSTIILKRRPLKTPLR